MNLPESEDSGIFTYCTAKGYLDDRKATKKDVDNRVRQCNAEIESLAEFQYFMGDFIYFAYML